MLSAKNRQLKILDFLVREYVESAEPVSSGLIANFLGNISSATVRNDLIELEEGGFLFHPYHSSGRIPTEYGYKFWVANFLDEIELSGEKKEILKKVFNSSKSRKDILKEMAKNSSKITGSVALVITGDEFYFTGISHLFSHEEFKSFDLIYALTEAMDNLDNLMYDLIEMVKSDVTILIGEDNPINNECAAIMKRIDRQNSLFALVSPMRTNYQETLALLKYLDEIL